jgi:ABC-type nickel/cobalt efflux system permease component RcnA
MLNSNSRKWVHRLTPAWPHRAANHFLHRVLRLLAFRKRRAGHGRHDLADHHVVIHAHPDRHVVDPAARRQGAAVRHEMGIGLNVG